LPIDSEKVSAPSAFALQVCSLLTRRWRKADSNSWSRFEKTPSKTRHRVPCRSTGESDTAGGGTKVRIRFHPGGGRGAETPSNCGDRRGVFGNMIGELATDDHGLSAGPCVASMRDPERRLLPFHLVCPAVPPWSPASGVHRDHALRCRTSGSCRLHCRFPWAPGVSRARPQLKLAGDSE
jgi:hypothetical protein